MFFTTEVLNLCGGSSNCSTHRRLVLPGRTRKTFSITLKIKANYVQVRAESRKNKIFKLTPSLCGISETQHIHIVWDELCNSFGVIIWSRGLRDIKIKVSVLELSLLATIQAVYSKINKINQKIFIKVLTTRVSQAASSS